MSKRGCRRYGLSAATTATTNRMIGGSSSVAKTLLLVCIMIVVYVNDAVVSAAHTYSTVTVATSSVARPKEQSQLSPALLRKLDMGKQLSSQEKKQIQKQELTTYKKLRMQGYDEVSNTREAAMLRNYRLRHKKRKGLLRKQEVSLASVLFPRVSPEEYMEGEQMWMYTGLVESKKTQVPFQYYDLPVCAMPAESTLKKKRRLRRNLGSRLQGIDMKPAPYEVNVKRDIPCTKLCLVSLNNKEFRWMRKLVERQYRVHLQLDGLPVLMRSRELNYAVRGYPIGFKAPGAYTGLKYDEFYLYNHMKFTITYHEDPVEFNGVRVVGFDVHPVSIQHDVSSVSSKTSESSTCNNRVDVQNDPSTYLPLRIQYDESGEVMQVLYTYEVQWIQADLPWSDRWDVYLVNAPDDDIHHYAIVNSIIIVVFMVAVFYIKVIKKLRTELQSKSDSDTPTNDATGDHNGGEETGWRAIRGDVFRPPESAPTFLCILVGVGAAVGVTITTTLALCFLTIVNPMYQGHIMTCIVYTYMFCGSPVSGYVSSRLYKYCYCRKNSDEEGTDDGNNMSWKIDPSSLSSSFSYIKLDDASSMITTDPMKALLGVVKFGIVAASAIPCLVAILFGPLNVLLGLSGAASAIPIGTLLYLILLWVCVSLPLVLVGCYVGINAPTINVPAEINDTIREIPTNKKELTTGSTLKAMFVGGIIPFSSLYVELAFFMSEIWLKQIYCATSFLIPIVLIMCVLCGQTTMFLRYRQLNAEDHRWWWSSFRDSATAGMFLFLYSLWYMNTRLELVGTLPVLVYLTFMTMVSFCLGVFCGSIGFVTSFCFIRKLYVKVE